LPEIQTGDMESMCVALDYLGVNFYRRSVMADGHDLASVNIKRVSPAGSEYTEMGWEVSPTGLYDILKFVHENYHPKVLYVTENGAAFSDVLHEGKIHDERRVNYLREHLAQLSRAIDDGIPLKGYFVWSLFDNFEWAYGYSKRFGIIHVDYKTQQRTIKDSGYFLAQVITENTV
jgi:beta-glucosidase